MARDWPVGEGRGFTTAELRGGKAVCLLGQTVRSDLFGDEDPIGARIRIDKVSCDVIGILSAKGKSTFGQDSDDAVLMPLTAVQRRLAGNTTVSTIWLSVASAGDIPRVKDDITRLLRERRHLSAGATDDFTVNDMQELRRWFRPRPRS